MNYSLILQHYALLLSSSKAVCAAPYNVCLDKKLNRQTGQVAYHQGIPTTCGDKSIYYTRCIRPAVCRVRYLEICCSGDNKICRSTAILVKFGEQ